MGLFDFFKGKEKESTQPEQIRTEESDQQRIQYETKVTAHELQADETVIRQVVDQMVEDDPFKRYYNGKALEDMTPLSKRIYKYGEITTVTIDFQLKEKNSILVVIEGTPIGYLPEEKAKIIQDYQSRFLLTAYVYVTGGPFIEYSKEEDKPVSGESRVGLDIFIQFT